MKSCNSSLDVLDGAGDDMDLATRDSENLFAQGVSRLVQNDCSLLEQNAFEADELEDLSSLEAVLLKYQHCTQGCV